jgi:PPOX class probable F420-dependent enzyme
VFNTHTHTVKGRNLTRDPRASILVDDEHPPFAFVHMRGRVTLSEDPDELLRTATEIAGRYMGADRAAEFGARNAVPGELIVRFTPERVIALTDVSG